MNNFSGNVLLQAEMAAELSECWRLGEIVPIGPMTQRAAAASAVYRQLTGHPYPCWLAELLAEQRPEISFEQFKALNEALGGVLVRSILGPKST